MDCLCSAKSASRREECPLARDQRWSVMIKIARLWWMRLSWCCKHSHVIECGCAQKGWIGCILAAGDKLVSFARVCIFREYLLKDADACTAFSFPIFWIRVQSLQNIKCLEGKTNHRMICVTLPPEAKKKMGARDQGSGVTKCFTRRYFMDV